MTDSFLTDDMLEQIGFSSRAVARRYRGVVPADDLYQEGLIWVYSHRKQVTGWMNDTENPKRGWARFTRAVEGAMTKVARYEKAAREGYDPRDEEFYGLAQIELCLPALWDQDFRVDGPQREQHEVTAGGDPSEGNTWAAMVMDVERAWNAADLDATQRSMLRQRFGPNPATYTSVARAHGCAVSTAEKYVKQALRRMQRELGGPKPQECDAACGDCGGPGSRRAISNAASRAITEENYDNE